MRSEQLYLADILDAIEAIERFAYGARKVYCVDRFPLVSIVSKNLVVIHQLAGTLGATERLRFDQCFKNPQAPEEGNLRVSPY